MDEVLLREAIDEKLKGTEIDEATILHPQRDRESELARSLCFGDGVV